MNMEKNNRLLQKLNPDPLGFDQYANLSAENIFRMFITLTPDRALIREEEIVALHRVEKPPRLGTLRKCFL